jgi:alanyl-tRNA synthetase
VVAIIADEEASFNRTLDQGVRHFQKVVAQLEASAGSAEKVIPAKEAHILFSSMGFPLDLTELMAAERGFSVDKAGFEALMEQDRKTSEAAEQLRKGGDAKDFTMAAEQTAYLQNTLALSPTQSGDFKYLSDQDGAPLALQATLQAIYLGRGSGQAQSLGEGSSSSSSAGFVESATAAAGTIALVFDKSSFYYESGGQACDTGIVHFLHDDLQFVVSNVQTYAGFVVHVGCLVGAGAVALGASASLHVDYERRAFIAPNHTMTHVMNYALRSVLLGASALEGSSGIAGQCDQKGSLVDADKLRFDFAWSSALTSAQIAEVENIVNARIAAALPVYSEVVPLSEATQIYALRKVFGETYPDPVRVVSVGASVTSLLADPQNTQWAGLSIEFCGGTHLSNTSQAEVFVLVEESGIAKGIRRIVGLTRRAAQQAKQRAQALLTRIAALEVQSGSAELVATFKVLKVEVGCLLFFVCWLVVA